MLSTCPNCGRLLKRPQRYKVCPCCQSRQWRASNPIRAAFLHIKRSAARRRHAFNLTLEEFTEWCYETDYIELKGRSSYHCDREDETRGYEIGNIRVLPASENSAQRRTRQRYVVNGIVRDCKQYQPDDSDEPF